MTHDRARREMRSPSRYEFANVIHYALTSANEIGSTDPQSYKKISWIKMPVNVSML